MVNNTISPQDYDAFRRYLEDICGIVLGDNKHYLVMSRLGRLMQENKLQDLGALVRMLCSGSGTTFREKVIEAMTTNETLWFRDGFPFDIVKDALLPELAEKRGRGVRPRVWSAACSSGQEPYSISMLAAEFLTQYPGRIGDLDIVATDISPAILEQAKQGIYDALTLGRGLSEERKRKYFNLHGANWQIRDDIRNRVTFRQQNLLQPYSLLGKFDIIFCRNVLIYFSSESKRDILSRMARALNPGGYLFLGSSETTSQYSEDYEMIRQPRGSVYRVREGLSEQHSSTTVTARATSRQVQF